MHRRLLAVLAATAVVISVSWVVPAAASAVPAVSRGGRVTGPTAQPYPPLDEPAGETCPFALHEEFPINHVVAYTFTNSAGRVVAAYYTGALFMTVTRVDTGVSRTYNISASGVQIFAKDGSSVLYGVGPFASNQHAGDHPGPQLDVLHGLSALAIAADGTKTIRYSTRVENVCAELA